MVYKKLKKTASEIKQDQMVASWYRKVKNIENKKKEIIVPKIKEGFFQKASKRLKGKSYKKFLKSAYWAKIRAMVLERDHYRCIVCGTADNLHIHHTTYENHFNEHQHIEDLQTLCKNHHVMAHRDNC